MAARDPAAGLIELIGGWNGDAIATQAALFEALRKFTAADFQRLINDAARVEELARALGGSRAALKNPLIEGLIDRWLDVDANAAFAWLAGRPKLIYEDKVAFDDAIAAFARKQPEGVLALALSMPAEKRRTEMVWQLILTVGETNLARAKEWIDRFPDEDARKAADTALRIAEAKLDPMSAATLAKSLEGWRAEHIWKAALAEAQHRGVATLSAFGEQARNSPVRWEALDALADRDPQAAAALMFADTNARNDDRFRPWKVAEKIASGLAEADPRAAMEWAEKTPETFRGQATLGVAGAWLVTDPQAAMEAPMLPHLRALAFSTWMELNETAARSYVQGLPPGEQRDGLMSALISQLAQSGRTREATALFARANSANGNGHLEWNLALAMAWQDPVAAAEWVAQLPPGRGQVRAIDAVANRWTLRDPAATAAWLDQLPAGEARDSAVKTFVWRVADLDQPGAASWVSLIGDSGERADAAAGVFQNWRKRDPAAAAAWMRSLLGIDEIRRKMILEFVP